MEKILQKENGETVRIVETEELYTSEANGAVRIRDSYGADFMPVTIPVAWKQIVEKYPDNPALRFKLGEEWETITYKKYDCMIRLAAKGFIKLELERFHSVCILANNSPESFVSNFAAIMAGGISVCIHPSSSPEACLHIINSSRANIVIVEDDVQLQKILKVKDQVPTLKFIIQYASNPTDPLVLNWSELLDMSVKIRDDILEKRINDLSVNQCCSIIFTSGTTGSPKAVMRSHDNILFNAKQLMTYLQLEVGNESVLSHSHMSDVISQEQDIYLAFISAACTYLYLPHSSLIDNLKAAKPTCLLMSPGKVEKVNEYIETNVLRNGHRFKHELVNRARKAALSHYEDIFERRFESEFIYKIYKIMVYNWIKRSVGLDKCKYFMSGGAPLLKSVQQNLMSLDLHVVEAYGLTECGGQALSAGNDIRVDCHGKALPFTRIKIDKPNENGEGEICLNGRHIFMGYLNDPEKTREIFDKDGWFHTGDIGTLDSQSYIKITGRIKEVIIIDNGDSIFPASIELKIRARIPVISHAVLVGESKKFLTLLITLKSEIDAATGMPMDELKPAAKEWCQSVGYPCDTVSKILREKPTLIYNAIKQGIDEVNSQAFFSDEKIQKFTILPKDFSLATGEMTRSMKLMRGVVNKKYEDEINKMYL